MFCTKCGKESAEGTKFCGGCGLNVEPVSANSDDVDQQKGGFLGLPRTADYVAKWKKMKTLPRILTGGVVGCGGCFLLIIIINIIGTLIGIMGNLIFLIFN